MLVSNRRPTCPARKSGPVTCHSNSRAALPLGAALPLDSLDVHPPTSCCESASARNSAGHDGCGTVGAVGVRSSWKRAKYCSWVPHAESSQRKLADVLVRLTSA